MTIASDFTTALVYYGLPAHTGLLLTRK